MALIDFPSDVPIVRSDLALQHPGQIVLQSIYGAGTQVYGRGPGYWSGRIEIAESDIPTDAQRRAVETFLAQLRGAENTFEVPIERPSAGDLTAGTSLTVSAAALSSGELEVTVSGATDGLVVGDYVRSGGRLYLLTSDLDTSKCTVEPPAVPDTSEDVVWEDVTCLARLAVGGGGGSIPLLWTPDFGGPWAIDWEEVV